jgi:hypothetical protein
MRQAEFAPCGPARSVWSDPSRDWLANTSNPRAPRHASQPIPAPWALAGRPRRASCERWDRAAGTHGLSDDAIPIEARTGSVCDAFSAMTTSRSYREAIPPLAATMELNRRAGALMSVVAQPLIASPHKRLAPLKASKYARVQSSIGQEMVLACRLLTRDDR